MKKVFEIAALLLALAACNKVETEITPVEQPSDSKGITITATLAPKTADTKAVADNGDNKITVTWAKNEHIAILYDKDGAQVADATITAVDGTTGAATITYTVVSGTADNTACTLVYPYSAAKDDKSGVKDAATLLSSQDGTLNANLDVRVGAGTIRTTTPSLDVTTQPEAQFAIFKFTVKNADASATIDVKPLTVTIGTQNYVITPASATSTLYVALPAVSSQTVSFSATGSDSKTYTCSKDGVTFTAGKYYQSTLKMAISVSSITINNAPTEALFVNSKGTLTATVLPDNATDKTVTWSSSDPDYVSINATTGEYEVKGTKGYGSATITATAGGKTATCTITGKVTYISLKAGDVIRTGDTFFVGKVYFNTTPAVSFINSNGVITLVENSGCYKFKRGSNGTMPNVTSYKVASNTDGIYIVSGSGTSTSDKFTIAVHTK